MKEVLFADNNLTMHEYSFFVLYSKDFNKTVLPDDAWEIAYKDAIDKYPDLKEFGCERYDAHCNANDQLNYLYGFYFLKELPINHSPEQWFMRRFPKLAKLEWDYDIIF